MDDKPLVFAVTHKMRWAIHLLAKGMDLVHYSVLDSTTGKRTLRVEKPSAGEAEKEGVKKKLFDFYQSPDGTDPITFDVVRRSPDPLQSAATLLRHLHSCRLIACRGSQKSVELRKFLNLETEALRLVHFSNYDRDKRKKILKIEKPVVTREQKKELTEQLVETPPARRQPHCSSTSATSSGSSCTMRAKGSGSNTTPPGAHTAGLHSALHPHPHPHRGVPSRIAAAFPLRSGKSVTE